MSESETLFVYGTLRPPQADTAAEDSRYFPAIAEHVLAHQPATVNNAELYDLGSYPAALPGEGALIGDLLQVEPAAIPIADRIEGHPTFYRRARITAQTKDGANIAAWIYWAPSTLVAGKRRVQNGNWFQRHQTPDETSSGATATAAPVADAADPLLRILIERFAEADCSWLSTVRPDARAHGAPVWHVWHQGRIYVVTMKNAVKVKNIAINPGVVITHPDPLDPVIIEGWATQAEPTPAQLRDLFLAKYDWDIANDTQTHVVLEITPTKLIAWGKYGEGKWHGADIMRIL
ncbi:MAG: gamma-glutamylcyclotransferase [Chloroflexi bacterium]|nr:gamma-glutamylcyclotransferase [Chloroflexota bacterium]